MAQAAKHLYEFGPFRIDPSEGLLLRDEQPIPLAPKAFEALLLLVESSGHLIEKGVLMQKLWPDSFVEEANLSKYIFTLRQALSDGEDGQKYIETVPKRGYRFVASVQKLAAESVEQAPAEMLSCEGEEAKTVTSTTRWRIALVSAALAATAMVLLVWLDPGEWRARLFGGPARPVRTIAVLPLQNLSGDTAQDYLADGMTEALTTDLARMESLQVISRTSAIQYKAAKKSLPVIARELNADAVV